jgi:cobalt-zinc-cadmium efflux system membrane fusion protein
MMTEPRTSPRRWIALATQALLAPFLLACGERGDAGHADHGHAHGEELAADDHDDHVARAAKTDPHHLAEDRVDCQDDVALPEGALERYGIEVEPVREVQLIARVAAPGHLAFPQGAVARVGAAVVGRVVELPVRSGEPVVKGATLLVIESAELAEAQSAYLRRRMVAAAAGPALELAESALARARELHDRVQGIALSEVQRLEAELGLAELDLEVARADEAAAESHLLLLGMSEAGIRALEESGRVEPRLAITAPIDGRVVEIAATLGELVGPDKDRLLVVGDLRTLWAIAEVSETRLSEVAVGAPAIVLVPALGDAASRGRVAAVATVLEASTRTAEVRIEVPNPDESMLPGMFIQVEIESSGGAGAPVMAVPDGAVLEIEGRPSVFVPLEPGSSVFCKHPIEVGPPVGTQIPVLTGLKPGELVVVAGTFRLKAEHGKAAAQHEH